MSDDELGRLLSEAFNARARDAVDDLSVPPPPRFGSADAGEELPPASVTDLGDVRARRSPASRPSRVLLPLSAAAAVIVLIGLVLAVVNRTDRTDHAAGPTHRVAHTDGTIPARLRGSGKPVHIKLLNGDGSKVGVGMPVIAYFSRKITSAKALQDVTTITADGRTLKGAWYFETSAAYKGYPYEAHLRTPMYWPAHAAIHVGIPTQGLTAGRGLVFDDSLTLDFSTGAANIATVDDTTHRLTLVSDGSTIGSYRVSLGAQNTPTTQGTKVIMDKGRKICLTGPGYNDCAVAFTQRLTYAGEYLHAAPWNVKHIRAGIDSSNGCTNLLPGDARTLYRMLRIGDVVKYPNADGPQMQLGDGYGDWNLPWQQWLTGGIVPTH